MAKRTHQGRNEHRSVTAPKGRPTRSRHDPRRSRPVGPVTQWLIVIVVALTVFAVLILVTDSGGADGAGAAVLGVGGAQPVSGSPAVVVVDSVGETIGGASQRM